MVFDICEQIRAIGIVDWIGMLSGLLGVWWSIREKTAAWAAYIVCYAAYVYISIDYGLRAFTALNLIFIVISVYGWIQWKRGNASESELSHPTRTPLSQLTLWAGALSLTTWGIAYLLKRTGESELLYWDSAACAIALAAQWFLSRKQIETWILWILSDLIYVGLFIHNQAWASAILFLAFIGLAVKGWVDWKAQLK